MRPLSNALPKCLLPVGGKPILQRLLENVSAAGIEQIGIVIGFNRQAIRSFVRQQFPFLRIHFMVNPKFETTNNAFSLLMARDFYLGKKDPVTEYEDLLLLDADIVFPPDLLPHLLAQSSPNKIAVRVRGDHDEEEVRVKIGTTGNILAIGKTTPLVETYGESIGIEIFSSSSARRLFEILELRVRNGEGRAEYYEATFQKMIDEGEKLSAIDVSNFATVEIDTPEDLQFAEGMVAEYADGEKR
jgi:choline kinase